MNHQDVEIMLVKADATIAASLIRSALSALDCTQSLEKVKQYLEIAQQILAQLQNTKI